MGIGIKAIEYYLPEKTVTNEQLAEQFADLTADKIYKTTGIKVRHYAGVEETALDMAEKASLLLLERNGLQADQLDFILFATQTPDYILPNTACLLQQRLGLSKKSGAFDFNLGCSAFIYGLAVAKGLIIAGIAKNVLLITSDTLSKFVNQYDKSVRLLFGDGAAATWISESASADIWDFDLGTDGNGAEKLIIPVGGLRTPKSGDTSLAIPDEYGNERTRENVYMNGAEIFTFSINTVPVAVANVLEKNRLLLNEIDLFVFHQANQYMLEYLRKKCKIDEDKFFICIENTGNTSSATIPIALAEASKEGRLKKGDKVLICGFGVGLSWGSAIIIW